jgi:hypothetical protein
MWNRLRPPLQCASHDTGRLWIQLRCGSCEAVSEAVVPNAVADRFGDDLERGMALIEAELDRLDREQMMHEVEVFAAALQHDLIEPVVFL